MKLKIISDGTADTKVVDVDTGEALDGVVEIHWSIKPIRGDLGHEVRCALIMEKVPIELVGDEIAKYELRNYLLPNGIPDLAWWQRSVERYVESITDTSPPLMMLGKLMGMLASFIVGAASATLIGAVMLDFLP